MYKANNMKQNPLAKRPNMNEFQRIRGSMKNLKQLYQEKNKSWYKKIIFFLICVQRELEENKVNRKTQREKVTYRFKVEGERGWKSAK